MLWAVRWKMAIVLAPKIVSRSSMIRRPSAIWYRICMMLSVLALSKCGKVALQGYLWVTGTPFSLEYPSLRGGFGWHDISWKHHFQV